MDLSSLPFLFFFFFKFHSIIEVWGEVGQAELVDAILLMLRSVCFQGVKYSSSQRVNSWQVPNLQPSEASRSLHLHL